MQHPHNCNDYEKIHSRRDFLTKFGMGLGAISLASLVNPLGANNVPQTQVQSAVERAMGKGLVPRAKRVIYLFQSGAPSQQDLFDYKPLLRKMHGQELPASVRKGQRLTGMTSGQGSLPLAGSTFNFKQYGQSGKWLSDRLPHLAEVADDICWVQSMYTEAINHDPAVMFFQTGSQFPGRPSMGAWASYGLGSLNENFPSFVVLLSRGSNGGAQPLYPRSWGSAFLPSQHQGVQFRAGQDPVLYLNNPSGITTAARRNQLDRLRELQELQRAESQDPEIDARIAQYEMAFRMQASVPDLMEEKEPDYIYDLYGPESRTPGTYAANCLLARRLAEKDVRFIQLYHRGWDAHGNCPRVVTNQARDTDQASAALIKDLKQRGLLEDTLVIWGGEFGRTAYSQGKLTINNYGRDHHPRAFSMWMAGAGMKPGLVYGKTDDFSYNIVENPVHVHDFQATVLHQLGIDHEALTFKHQGRRFRLTDVHGKVVKGLLS
ncbi:DUF1501 domain-containing protein [Neolewinella agarilytica]|uniref:Tat (Twin-arginine translocation) pathway signal sequence n=1 Tax=Neolewinella agarilytica TaxID=478744 RepID=A0A1H9KVZ5_9BACT|nr:DUF1501 domain-containing protein [Neolewinella agarilytica]SER03364.1 Protein of unknown function [Neolewinella agarilytica]